MAMEPALNGATNNLNGRKFPDYIAEKELCVRFLSSFKRPPEDDLDQEDIPIYRNMLQEVANRRRAVVSVALDDVMAFDTEGDLASNIINNTYRYVDMFGEAVDELLPQPNMDIERIQSVFDVLQNQRHAQRLNQQVDDPENNENMAATPPSALTRRFQVVFQPPTKLKAASIRQVKASQIGHIVKVKGMVTRVSDVKPLMCVVTYSCESCGFEVYQEVKGRSFLPLQKCPTENCKTNNDAGRLFIQTKGSRFIKFQEAKIQELPDQVPMGHIPRTSTIYLRGDLTRKCSPGDVITATAIFLPVRHTGFRQIKQGLLSDTYFEAMDVLKHKKSYSEIEFSQDLEAALEHAIEHDDTYTKLARSIAPEIYGMEDVKKALLLLLVGGVTKKMKDGMKIRGDINICLMGDPGVAKSQLLKHITSIAPRAVYTTGKGSSGVGLTAAVVKDTVTNEMTLEGGALVLADKGICCIDEFDKMDDSDRTAIHEVMEQQTVSIAKAGITTTLNARTSVLAAANPIYGRYNARLSASKNINLPNALLSRFDLLFLLLDKPDRQNDIALAKHVTHVHRFRKNPEMEFIPYEPRLIQYYIAQARQYDPAIPEELGPYIVEAYVELRQQDFKQLQKASKSETERENCGQTAMTARQLLSILRLSQALARLRFSSSVNTGDVDEAIRLVHVSKASILEEEETRNYEDPVSRIFNLIKDFAQTHTRDLNLGAAVDYAAIEPIVIKRGFTRAQLMECIEQYENLNIWHLSGDRTKLYFVDSQL